MTTETLNHFHCLRCKNSVSMGGGKWTAKASETYKGYICNSCWEFNHDGFSEWFDHNIEEHCRSKGIAPPERDLHGCYPRGLLRGQQPKL
jgi:hypothetical protein